MQILQNYVYSIWFHTQNKTWFTWVALFYCKQCNVVYMYLIYRNNDGKLKGLNSNFKENWECTYYFLCKYDNCKKEERQKKNIRKGFNQWKTRNQRNFKIIMEKLKRWYKINSIFISKQQLQISFLQIYYSTWLNRSPYPYWNWIKCHIFELVKMHWLYKVLLTFCFKNRT